MHSLWILGAFFPTPLFLIVFPAFTSLFPSPLLPNCPIVADTLPTNHSLPQLPGYQNPSFLQESDGHMVLEKLITSSVPEHET